jgi:hypothetical protein
MKKFFQTKLAIISTLVMLVLPLAVPVAVSAAPADPSSSKALCEGSGGTWDGATNACGKAGTKSFPEELASVTNLLLFIIGAIAVIMIIIGGIRYVTSSGDQAQTTAAKNTILYAVIGVVMAFMAYAIINFVVAQMK